MITEILAVCLIIILLLVLIGAITWLCTIRIIAGAWVYTQIGIEFIRIGVSHFFRKTKKPKEYTTYSVPIGKKGMVVDTLKPYGKVNFDNKIMDAMSIDGRLEYGSKVVGVKMGKTCLLVEKDK